MGPEGIILVNPPITTCQQSLTHSALFSSLSPPAMNTHVHSKQAFPLAGNLALIQELSASREPEAL